MLLAAAPLADPRLPEVVAALHAKHLAAPPLHVSASEVPAMQVDGDVLERANQRWERKRGTAGSVTGLTRPCRRCGLRTHQCLPRDPTLRQLGAERQAATPRVVAGLCAYRAAQAWQRRAPHRHRRGVVPACRHLSAGGGRQHQPHVCATSARRGRVWQRGRRRARSAQRFGS